MIEKMFPQGLNRFWASILSIMLAICIGAVIILLNGDNPLQAYLTMFQKSLGSAETLAASLAVATPLIFTGLSVATAFRTGMDNIGSEGQLYMGAFAAAWIGISFKGLWGPLHIFLALLAGIVAGGLWAWIFGWLKVRFNVDLVVTTIMANYLAILFTSYLANYPFKPPNAPIGSTAFVPDDTRLFQFFPFSTLNIGFLIALGCLLAFGLFFHYSRYGFEWKTVGYNQAFARFIGIDVNRAKNWAMFVSGAFAGIAGAVEVLGVQGRFVQNMSPGYGYDGILVALLAGNTAPGILAVAILFGALRIGGIGVEQTTNVPSELSQVLQSIIILLVAGQAIIFQIWNLRRRRKSHDLGRSVHS
jgi:simple sugar transport system permease protein